MVELDTGLIQGYSTCLFVYVEPNRGKRKYFLRQLAQKIKQIRRPLLCIGDWTCIQSKEDKIGGQHIPIWKLKEANIILNEGNLIDLGYTRPPFTWFKKYHNNNNNGNTTVEERL